MASEVGPDRGKPDGSPSRLHVASTPPATRPSSSTGSVSDHPTLTKGGRGWLSGVVLVVEFGGAESADPHDAEDDKDEKRRDENGWNDV
jgi:hypothetical protein